MPPRPVIHEFEQPKHERVLAPHRVRTFYLFFIPLILSFALCGVGGWLNYDADGDGVDPVGAALVGVGVVLFAGYLVFESCYIGVYPARCYLRWLRQKIDARPDAVVAADDPAAFFVQHIPEKNWQVNVGENATDVGLLLIDYDRRILKYEGDSERWLVPAEAIVSFKLTSFTPPMGNEAINRHTVVMLRVELDDGDELVTPLAGHPVHWRRWTPAAKEAAARALRQAIGHLADPDRWDRPTAAAVAQLIPPPR